MSMNKYMHPRNIYKNRPDFKQLAIDYEEFRNIAQLDLCGKVSINFQDKNTLRVLAKVLLKKDFELNVILPEEKLVPTLPLRLNYILWLEDIFNTFKEKFNCITGIDIGCGASCIYPLLIAKHTKWKMYGLEINEDSINYAKININKNDLTETIKIIAQNENNGIFTNIIQESVNTYDFCMCNPPFYESEDDLNYDLKQNRTTKRPPPNNARTGTTNELIFDGGEVNFVKKIIDESCLIKNKISIYTTMLGHKYSVNEVIKLFKENLITNFLQCEFCQGNTTRWGIAWTFRNDLFLRKVTLPYLLHDSKLQTPISFQLNNLQNDLNFVANEIKNLLLSIDTQIIDNSELKLDTIIEWDCKALKNTWSHQRRIKRHEKYKNLTPNIENKINKEIELINNSSDDEYVLNSKRIKLSNNEIISNTTTDITITKQSLIIFNIKIIKNKNKQIVIELLYLDGSYGKDGICQIRQFLINYFNKKIQ